MNDLQLVGYTATTYEGKRYVKANTLSPVDDTKGKGMTIAVINVDPSQEPKLSKASFPCVLKVLKQEIKMAKAGDRQVAQVFFTEIEVGQYKSPAQV
jgi:hypothetical protein